MIFFNNCKSLDEIKIEYRTLAKLHHPDRGGDVTTMQAVNNDYAYACARMASGNTEEVQEQVLDAKAYQNAINAIIAIVDIEIEVVGFWIWVTGNTYPYRKIFAAAGFFFARKKQAWYFRTSEYKTRNRHNMTLDEIRQKYGSQKVDQAKAWSKFIAA